MTARAVPAAARQVAEDWRGLHHDSRGNVQLTPETD
jgi:hypothetical protein